MPARPGMCRRPGGIPGAPLDEPPPGDRLREQPRTPLALRRERKCASFAPRESGNTRRAAWRRCRRHQRQGFVVFKLVLYFLYFLETKAHCRGRPRASGAADPQAENSARLQTVAALAGRSFHSLLRGSPGVTRFATGSVRIGAPTFRSRSISGKPTSLRCPSRRPTFSRSESPRGTTGRSSRRSRGFRTPRPCRSSAFRDSRTARPISAGRRAISRPISTCLRTPAPPGSGAQSRSSQGRGDPDASIEPLRLRHQHLSRCDVPRQMRDHVRGPGRPELLGSGQAFWWPPRTGAAASAIQEAWENQGLRERVAENGQRYALSLGGEKELLERVFRKTAELLTT